MRRFRDKHAPEGDDRLAGRIEPTLGPIPKQETTQTAPRKLQPTTQSGVPILPAGRDTKRANAWARFWALRDGEADPPSLSEKANSTREPTADEVASIWTESGSHHPSMTWAGLSLRILAAVIVLGVSWFATMMAYYNHQFPDPMAAHAAKSATLKIVSRDGSLLAERDGKHLYIPVEMLPQHVTNAVIAIEDRRFHRHAGVDFSGLLRAAFANLRAGRYAQGGSTLTQQLAKNMYLSPERTMMRKLDELLLAVWLEMRLEKHEILELYLNQVYFGGGAYGIEAAAQRHFGKSARALSIVEGAIIAGLLKAPSRYSPSNNPASARRRGRVVLKAMNEARLLTDAELAKALRQPVRFAKKGNSKTSVASDFATDLILERMPPLHSSDADTIIVETTIDSDLQERAQRHLAETLSRDGKKLNAGQGAIVVLDSAGGIRALVGGINHASSQYNRAVKAERQPGSTFKPFVYLSALENGMTPETVVEDRPLKIDGWAPRNSNGKYRGEVTLREALASSINTVAVRLALEATPSIVAATARRAGISSELREEASLALGTSEVNLLDLTGAYALFANGGRRVEPYVISRILTSSGRVIYANADENSEIVVDLRHVGAMNDMLNAALVAGTGRKAALVAHPAAGKTGTSQDFRDAWFVGYTAHLTTGIWLGNDNGQPMNRVVGGSLPAKIWHSVMSKAHESLPPRPLPGTYRPELRTKPGPEPRTARADRTRQIHARMPVPPLPTRKSAKSLAKAKKVSPGRIVVKPPRTRVAKPSTAAAAIDSSALTEAGTPASAPATETQKSLAPTKPPPLPTLHKKVTGKRIARPRVHPGESISADFIARAVQAVPERQKARKKELAETSTGFDVNEIRRRLNDAPAATDRRKPYMALGADREPR